MKLPIGKIPVGKALSAFCLMTLILPKSLLAQSNRFLYNSNVGFAAGVMNYSGYMNPKGFTFSQAKPAGELMYRYDVTDNFHIRATGLIGALGKDNTNTPDAQLADRSGKFTTDIGEVDILPEYDFLNIREKHWSPYVYIGGGFYRLFNYKASGVPDGAEVKEFGFNFRGGIGFKYAISPAVQVFLEGDRREFSKEIDFYDSHSRSRYYSIMAGLIFSLEKKKYKELW